MTTSLQCYTVEVLHIPTNSLQRTRITPELRIASSTCHALNKYCPRDEYDNKLYHIHMGTINVIRNRHYSSITTVMEYCGQTITIRRQSPLRKSYTAASQTTSPPSSPSTNVKIPRVASDPILEELLEELYTQENNYLLHDIKRHEY